LQALYTDGTIPVTQLTGVASDVGVVYAVGRDDDSGTRAIFETDTGLGFGASLTQYGITSNSVAAPYVYTIEPSQSVHAADGNGYSSGGNVKTALQLSNPGTYKADGVNLSYAIAYIAVSDWNGAGLSALAYNGATFSVAAVEQGTYSYWGLENVNVRTSDDSGNFQTVVGDITTAQTALAGNSHYAGTLQPSVMNCSRNDDGQPIFYTGVIP